MLWLCKIDIMGTRVEISTWLLKDNSQLHHVIVNLHFFRWTIHVKNQIQIRAIRMGKERSLDLLAFLLQSMSFTRWSTQMK